MMVERQGFKGGGGYVGGFLNLFDWNAKYRKKLFSNKSDLPEQSKQKKRSDGNLPITRFHLTDDDENVAGSSIKESSDYSSDSSVTDEEVCGRKAPGPGVVARLMGLDSLPTSNFSEAYSTPSFDSISLQDSHYHRKNLEFHHGHQIMHSGNLHIKVEASIRNFMEAKPQKMIRRPIEKFQTETLPPKSVKLIPITQHKLLSPIKSSSFVPSKNVAHIMETAVKTIESGHQTTTKEKMPLVGSSLVPLKIRDLKQKVEADKRPTKLAEASRRPIESNAAKYLKGQSLNKSWNGSVDAKSLSVSSDLEEYSFDLKNKGKSISLALQAKANVQKREGLNLSGNRNLFGQKEQSEVMSSQIFKNQPNTQRSTHKKSSTHNASSVLRQNNQKQNCLVDRGKLPSKSLASNSQGRKISSKISGNSKVVSRKSGLEVIDSKKEVPYSRRKTITSKKRPLDRDFQFEKNNFEKNGKTIQYNAVVDRRFGQTEDNNQRKGMDVVSFTFTAPMARSIPGPGTSREVVEKNNGGCVNYQGKKVLLNSYGTNGSKLSSLRYNIIGGEPLSTLLEQKLRDLTRGVDFSRHKADKMGSQCSFGFSSTDLQGLIGKPKPQGIEEMDECGSNDNETRKLLNCRHPSPISVLEPSYFTESCNSSDTADSSSSAGSKHCSSVQAQAVFGTSSSKKFHLMEADTELSDSASSTSTRTAGRKHVESTVWELEYVKEIMCNVELMFKDFASGGAHEIINPRLFDQLETRKGVSESQRRKVLFDCVGECVDLRCRRYVGGGCKLWAKGLSVVRSKIWLAEEVHKEISRWKEMRNCVVDELVDADMSRQHGRWVDFEVEVFEFGVEIEGGILDYLVNEVVADILLL